MATEPKLIECSQLLETCTRYERDRIEGLRPVQFGRWKCACGHSTRWFRSPVNAEKARDAHAMPGKLRVDW